MSATGNQHEFGCTAGVGRPCICRQLRLERGPHSQHRTPVPGCDLCDSLVDEAREVQAERPWEAA